MQFPHAVGVHALEGQVIAQPPLAQFADQMNGGCIGRPLPEHPSVPDEMQAEVLMAGGKIDQAAAGSRQSPGTAANFGDPTTELSPVGAPGRDRSKAIVSDVVDRHG